MRFLWQETYSEQICKHIDKHIFGLNNNHSTKDKEIKKWEKTLKCNYDDVLSVKSQYRSTSNCKEKIHTDLCKFYNAAAQNVLNNPDSVYFYVTLDSKIDDEFFSLNFSNKDLCVCLKKHPYKTKLIDRYRIHSCFYKYENQRFSELIAVFVSNDFRFKSSIKMHCGDEEVQKSIDETLSELKSDIYGSGPRVGESFKMMLTNFDGKKLKEFELENSCSQNLLRCIDAHKENNNSKSNAYPLITVSTLEDNIKYLETVDEDTEFPLINAALYEILANSIKENYDENALSSLKAKIQNKSLIFKDYITSYLDFIIEYYKTLDPKNNKIRNE